MEKFWRAVIFPVLNMHALILQFIFSLCVYIAFLCSTISLLVVPCRAQLVPSNWMYLSHYGCFCFSLTKVIHMLAHSFFAPTIYVWIICHRRVCADEILSLCVLIFFFSLSKGRKSCMHFIADCRFLPDLCSRVCVYTIWRMIWSNCAVFMFIHESLIK